MDMNMNAVSKFDPHFSNYVMEIKLRKTDDELKRKFFQLRTRADIADLLEIDEKTLIFLLYRNKLNNYKEFKIPKKSGGERTIQAPVSTLKILQRKLSYILYLVYKERFCAHAFSKNKSIRTNAEGHVGKKNILNLDLKDFFDSITINRIIGRFMKKPYELPKQVAVVLAQICASPFGYLPQGAPTSPIISNMICSRMDSELRKLARERKCFYTRYADDITFSSPRSFANSIAKIDYVDEKIVVSVGDTLKEIIERNTFSINKKKVHFHNRGSRQEVCGLVVNKRLNVKKRLMKQVRALIYILKTNKKLSALEKERLSQRIRGKLNFISFVRSKKDRAYRVLLNQYNKIFGLPELPLETLDEIRKGTWFLEVDGQVNGSAFVLNNELITCFHVIKSGSDIKACRWVGDTKISYQVSVIKKNQGVDLAKLKFDEIPEPKNYFSLDGGDSDHVTEREEITVAGFGYITDQKDIVYADAKILTIRKTVFPYFVVTPGTLIIGMSGGPAISESGQVVGVNGLGWDHAGDVLGTDFYGVIPINYLNQVN